LSGQRSIVLDRCNASKEDRKKWFAMMIPAEGAVTRGTVAIFFDLKSKICINRILERKNHPTLPPEQAQRASTTKAVKSFEKILDPPHISEGFQRVHVIRSQIEFESILAQYGTVKTDIQA
jgi:hypothetical protein